MYKLMLIISGIIRSFCISNPFDVLGERIIVNMGEILITTSPEILNLVAEPFVHIMSFGIVGLYYNSGSNAALGSFLYMLFYCIHILLLKLMSLSGFSIWVVVLIITIYVGVHLALSKVFRRSLE